MKQDLSLVPIEDLVEEISDRHTDCLVLATRDMDHTGPYVFHSLKVSDPINGLNLLKYGKKKIIKNFL